MKQKGFSLIELTFTILFMGFLMVSLYHMMSVMSGKSRISPEINFLNTFFMNIQDYDLKNIQYLDTNNLNIKNKNQNIKIDLKKANTPLTRTQLLELGNYGIINMNYVNNSGTGSNTQEVGSINSYLGPAIIYPYGLTDRLNGKATIREIKGNELTDDFYTVSYPTVSDNDCVQFISELKNMNQAFFYTIMVNNILVSSPTEGIQALGNSEHFEQICKTDEKHPYNTISVSNE